MKKTFYNYSREEMAEKFKGQEMKAIFARIHQEQFWGDPESVSGPGSSLAQTREIIRLLPALLQKYQIRSILDIPCGDLNWMKEIDLQGIQYTGADIVPEIIERNHQRFSFTNYQFDVLDLTRDTLPQVDLILCRDCLVHFSFRDIQAALQNLRQSGSAYLLTTTFFGREKNVDITTGDWRPLNFQAPPFNWPAPIDLLVEQCTELEGRYADKALGWWKLADI